MVNKVYPLSESRETIKEDAWFGAAAHWASEGLRVQLILLSGIS